MGINWVDDSVSAVISTFLAIGISFWFYRKGNRDAFMQDVLEPLKCLVKESNSEKNFLRLVSEKRKLYTFRYAKNKEKEKISMMEEACRNKVRHSYDNAFSEAIWNFFYNAVGEERTYVEFNEELGESRERLNYPDKYVVNLKEYSYWVNPDGTFACGDEIKQQLISFYNFFIKGNVGVKQVLGEFDIDNVIENSPEYKKYLEANREFEKIRQDFLRL